MMSPDQKKRKISIPHRTIVSQQKTCTIFPTNFDHIELAKLNRVHVEGLFTLDLHWELTRVNVSSPFAMVGDPVLVRTELGECGQQACIFEFYFTFLTHILCSEHIYEIEFYFMNDWNLLNVLDTTANYFIRVEPAEECALVPEGYPPSCIFFFQKYFQTCLSRV